MYFYLSIATHYIIKIFKSLVRIVRSLTVYTSMLLWIMLIAFFCAIFNKASNSLQKIQYDNKLPNYFPRNPIEDVPKDHYEVEDELVTKIKTLNPALVWWTPNARLNNENISCLSGRPGNITCEVFKSEDRLRLAEVSAYLFYASVINFKELPLPRQPEKIIWGLFHEESPRNVPELMHEKSLSLFNFSATFSRHSDVPFPLFSLPSWESITDKTYFIETSVKNTYLDEISPILYMQTDCETSSERDEYVEKLMQFIQIDSYGACLNNKELPENLKGDYLNNLYNNDNLRFIAKYKFFITMENGVCDDYVSEKLWRAIKVGTVPIYFGSPLVRDWLPNNKSAILINDFASPKLLSEHINKIMRDDDLYEEHLEHKTKGLVTNNRIRNELLQRPYQLDNTALVHTFECFICRKVHEMKYKTEVNIVRKSHYNCPKPISALTNRVQPLSTWVQLWEHSKRFVDKLYADIMNKSASL